MRVWQRTGGSTNRSRILFIFIASGGGRTQGVQYAPPDGAITPAVHYARGGYDRVGPVKEAGY